MNAIILPILLGFGLLSAQRPAVKWLLVWGHVPDSNLRFIVQSSTRLDVPMTKWPVKAIVETNGMPFEATNRAEFFVVRASNILTGMVSDYAKGPK